MRSPHIWHLSLVFVVLFFTISCSSFHSNISSLKLQSQKPLLILKASNSSLMFPGEVEFVAKIEGDINWCPDEIIWQWVDGFSREEVDCEKIFSRNRRMIYGNNRVWIKVFHNGKLMGVEFVDVRVED